MDDNDTYSSQNIKVRSGPAMQTCCTPTRRQLRQPQHPARSGQPQPCPTTRHRQQQEWCRDRAANATAQTSAQDKIIVELGSRKSTVRLTEKSLPYGNAPSVDEKLSSSLCRLATHRAHARSFLALLLLLGQPRLPVLHQPLSASMSTRCPLHGSRRRVSVFSCIAEIWSHIGLLFGCSSQILPMRHLDCWAALL